MTVAASAESFHGDDGGRGVPFPGKFLIGAAIGSGNTALAAEHGGADILRAIVDGLPTLFSAPDAGHIRNCGIAVNASDGTYADRVELSWDPWSWGQPAFDVEYRLFRGTTEDFRTAEEIFHSELRTQDNYPAGVTVTPAATTYQDRDAAPGKVHYYSVIGMDSQGCSPLADPEKGHAKGP